MQWCDRPSGSLTLEFSIRTQLSNKLTETTSYEAGCFCTLTTKSTVSRDQQQMPLLRLSGKNNPWSYFCPWTSLDFTPIYHELHMLLTKHCVLLSRLYRKNLSLSNFKIECAFCRLKRASAIANAPSPNLEEGARVWKSLSQVWESDLGWGLIHAKRARYRRYVLHLIPPGYLS